MRFRFYRPKHRGEPSTWRVILSCAYGIWSCLTSGNVSPTSKSRWTRGPLAALISVVLISSITYVGLQTDNRASAATLSYTANPTSDTSSTSWRTNWTRTGGGSCTATQFWGCVNDYSDTTPSSYLQGPNKSASGLAQFNFTTTPANTGSIAAITVNATGGVISSGVSGGADTQTASIQIFESNGTTPLTNSCMLHDSSGITSLYDAYFVLSCDLEPTGNNTKTAWDSAILVVTTAWAAVGGADTTMRPSLWSLQLDVDYNRTPTYLASSVIGQYDRNGSTSYTNPFPNAQNGFDHPYGVAFDSTSNSMFVADSTNSRVLVYAVDAVTDTTASQPYAVLGQPDLVTTTSGTSAIKMSSPTGVAVDSSGRRLFVSEYDNGRVLVFDINTIITGEAAQNVLGKANFTTTGTSNGQAGLGRPYMPSFQSGTNLLFVPDSTNNRVMVWDTTSITNGENATYVLGQSTFTNYTSGTTSQKFNYPMGTAIDDSRDLFILADCDNSRVMIFDISSMSTNKAASNVIGQAAFGGPSDGLTATQLNYPQGVGVDESRDRLYVADSDRNGVTVYDISTLSNGPSASFVLGQSGMTSGSTHLDNTGFNVPIGVTHDPMTDRIYVADYENNRIMSFAGNVSTNNPTAVDALGHVGEDGNPDYTNNTINARTPTSWGIWTPGATTVDSTNHRLFVADRANNRVLVHTLDSSNRLIDRSADYVLGQSSFSSRTTGVTQSTMNEPTGVAYQSSTNRLFVVDRSNRRVLVYDVAAITNGENAANVLGQPNFTTNSAGLTQAKMNKGWAVAVDSGGNRLFVSDQDNHRVLVYDIATIVDGENAANVLGQPDFVTSTASTTAARLDLPAGIAHDSTNNRLYVGDQDNARVVVYDVTGITNGESAVNVLGQPNLTTGTPGLNASTLDYGAGGVTIDTAGQRLWVADNGNNRVLQFDVATVTNGESATRVFGQDSFTTEVTDAARDGLDTPAQVYFDATTKLLYISDVDNNRIVIDDTDTQITTAITATVTVNTAYTGQLASSNPNGTHAYSVTSGSLPTGVSLSGAGTFSGTPTVIGTYNFTVTTSVTVTGHGTLTGTRAYTIDVQAPPNTAPQPPTSLAQTRSNGDGIPKTGLYDWDASIQGWSAPNGGNSLAGESTTKRTGGGSLHVTLTGTTNALINDSQSSTRDMSANGQTFSVWVFVPTANTGGTWTAQIQVTSPTSGAVLGPTVNLPRNTWNLVTYTVPPTLISSMQTIALSITGPGSTGTNHAYVDDFQQGNAIWTSDTTVRFTATVADQDGTDTDQLCIEAQPIGTGFTGTEQSCGTGVAYSGSPVAAVHSLSSLVNGTQYHWQARAKDAGGLYSSWVAYGGNVDTVTASPDFGIDTSNPSTGAVRDGSTQGVDIGFNSGSLDTLSANWSGFSDAASGIALYQYSIGTSPGATDVAGWTSVGATVTEVTRTSLTLSTSTLYYFNVRATDLLGNTSSTVSSNGQYVSPTLVFSVSTPTLNFDRLGTGNSFTDTVSVDLITSTNARNGYAVRQWAATTLTDSARTVPFYSGTYASPTAWSGTGFGYTSNDTSIQSSGDKFAGATKYASMTTSDPGDIVADHTSAIVGTSVTNETFTLTYRVTASATQAAGTYSTVINLSATAIF